MTDALPMHHQVHTRTRMTVELVRHTGDDADVLHAARVSTAGDRTLEDWDAFGELTIPDVRLLNYLMRDRHGSPFEHNSFTFYVHAPIFVFRELMRHRMASYNEESGRYKELEPVFYVPAPERKLVQVGKPGAYTFEDGTDEQRRVLIDEVIPQSMKAYESYRRMLDAGIAREVARIVLPLNIYSSAYVTVNARSLMNFLSLRRKVEGSTFPSFPQREIELVAEQMEELWASKMPNTHDVFVRNGRVAP
jgi:thymidylate synthase (FAD)